MELLAQARSAMTEILQPKSAPMEKTVVRFVTSCVFIPKGEHHIAETVILTQPTAKFATTVLLIMWYAIRLTVKDANIALLHAAL